MLVTTLRPAFLANLHRRSLMCRSPPGAAASQCRARAPRRGGGAAEARQKRALVPALTAQCSAGLVSLGCCRAVTAKR